MTISILLVVCKRKFALAITTLNQVLLTVTRMQYAVLTVKLSMAAIVALAMMEMARHALVYIN